MPDQSGNVRSIQSWHERYGVCLRKPTLALGSDTAARDWVFAPNGDLDGITPAEAVQYKTQATGVGRLLEAEAVRRREEARSERPTPVVIEGGRSTSGLPGSIARA